MQIALDADGVMLDYISAYAKTWEKAFGEIPKLVNPNAYWAKDRYAIKHLSGNELKYFKTFFDDEFWENVPVLPNAVEACNNLVNAGYEVFCVSALPEEYQNARLCGLQKHGFKINKCYATGHPDYDVTMSPKAGIINKLKPKYFVDDYIIYHRGISKEVHKALITRENEGSPNQNTSFRSEIEVDSEHCTLIDFSNWLLNAN